MNPTLAGALAGLVIALPTTLLGIYVAVQNARAQRRTQTLEERKVEQSDVDRSLAVLREEVKRLTAKCDDLETDLTEERRARQAAERSLAQANERARRAEDRAERLERRVAHLEQTDEGSTT